VFRHVPFTIERDETAEPGYEARRATGTKVCDHRQTEERDDGKTYCRDCERQLYL
jgi:hypothetical protein